MVVVGKDRLYTWQRLRVTTILSRRQPVSYPACHIDIPAGVSLLRDKMALPLAAGSAIVEGVKLTVQTRDADIRAPASVRGRRKKGPDRLARRIPEARAAMATAHWRTRTTVSRVAPGAPGPGCRHVISRRYVPAGRSLSGIVTR